MTSIPIFTASWKSTSFYGKLEEHFVHGTDLGYYADSNPNGEKPRSNVLAAKIGFSF